MKGKDQTAETGAPADMDPVCVRPTCSCCAPFSGASASPAEVMAAERSGWREMRETGGRGRTESGGLVDVGGTLRAERQPRDRAQAHELLRLGASSILQWSLERKPRVAEAGVKAPRRASVEAQQIWALNEIRIS